MVQTALLQHSLTHAYVLELAGGWAKAIGSGERTHWFEPAHRGLATRGCDRGAVRLGNLQPSGTWQRCQKCDELFGKKRVLPPHRR
jgi:hypothetical protein